MTQIAPPLPTGAVLDGAWRVGKPLAVGGFAVVYEGRRVADGEAIAIKALRVDALEADHAAAQRFEREAQVAVGFDHPHVVRTLAHGRTHEGVPWIVMEHLHGQPLSAMMYQEPFSAARVHRIIEQILCALEAAHGRGFVHRDLKPSNVFVCQAGDADLDEPRVKVLDFGFVKVLDSDDPTLNDPLTLMGERVGTPGYMAPEMLKQGVVTPQVDLYAVGLIAYELLTGHKAYAGEGLQRAREQLEHDPAPPPEAIAALPLYAVVERLFARSPRQRFKTAREALDALGAGRKRRWFEFWR